MKMQIDGNDLLAAVAGQRNDALDDAANNAAKMQALLRLVAERDKRIAELEKQIADASSPAE
jgi:hypothetical protein